MEECTRSQAEFSDCFITWEVNLTSFTGAEKDGENLKDRKKGKRLYSLLCLQNAAEF